MLTNTHPCSVTHGTNGHTHGLWPPSFTFRCEYSTQELPEPPLPHLSPSCPLLTCAHMHTAHLHHSCHAHTRTCPHARLHAPMPPGTPPPPHTLGHSHLH